VAEETLRQKLLRVYLTMLQENGFYPGAIFLCRRPQNGSRRLSDSRLLHALEAKGVRIVVCQTRLQYFGLTDRVVVGIVGGMNEIVLAQWMASKVITL
jgi:hypothetical protein